MSEERNEPGPRWWRWIVASAAVAVVLAGVGAWWLVDPLSVDEPKDRANAMQAALAIAFGFGGLATLGLFTRRQWHQERVHEHERQVAADARRESERAYEHQQRVADDARYDAEQRRITEQYMKAVEQLGHEKAPVRLGGLYALDRLGRNHPEQRQVIAEVWCAYLRRRYTPPVDIIGEIREGDEGGEEADRTEEQLQAEAEAADEYEVRMTAQRLLVGHLKDPRPKEERNDTRPNESEEYWHLEHIDLTGATLVDTDFADCRLPEMKIGRARLCRSAQFNRTYFEGDAEFSKARFEGEVWFDKARFEGAARFGAAQFKDEARFAEVQFSSDAWFTGARVSGTTVFTGARFGDVAWFPLARFDGSAWFNRVRFEGDTGFTAAWFKRSALFFSAWFEGGALFKEARFGGIVKFEDLQLGARVDNSESEPVRLDMSDAVVNQVNFKDEKHAWPPGWETVPDGDKWKLVRIEE
ncbi:pentapeptide repeat-containing protein [Glycomyces tenuis]|uniref:pentapeptide repeat-containing protein n=3 Tax=Glycomyces tenuis TaxID=58116 RepID=UPI00138AD174|nr:pentapeptide repeat-containing protein [Glycomyces tenuis]